MSDFAKKMKAYLQVYPQPWRRHDPEWTPGYQLVAGVEVLFTGTHEECERQRERILLAVKTVEKLP